MVAPAVGIGDAHLALGHPELAVAPLEHALRVLIANDATQADLAGPRLSLAQALVWHTMPAAHAVRQDLREVLLRSSAAAVCARTQARHPASRYFTRGRFGADQVADYAKRKGMPLAEIERWLSPNLGYDPAAAPAA